MLSRQIGRTSASLALHAVAKVSPAVKASKRGGPGINVRRNRAWWMNLGSTSIVVGLKANGLATTALDLFDHLINSTIIDNIVDEHRCTGLA